MRVNDPMMLSVMNNRLTVLGVAGDGSFLCNRLAREHCELDQ